MKSDKLIRNEGMEALIAKLGYVDAERFIMLVSREPFDYTEWRQEHLQDNMSIRELSNMAMMRNAAREAAHLRNDI
ncbi:MAG TPA: hypothetical protein DCR27_11845 [Lachnospiraceae bacterium]|nr:hypothetical protein [Lachnospiraceae bacterium]